MFGLCRVEFLLRGIDLRARPQVTTVSWKHVAKVTHRQAVHPPASEPPAPRAAHHTQLSLHATSLPANEPELCEWAAWQFASLSHRRLFVVYFHLCEGISQAGVNSRVADCCTEAFSCCVCGVRDELIVSLQVCFSLCAGGPD